MWQAKADTELTLSALPATAVGQILLTMAKFCYNTVYRGNAVNCIEENYVLMQEYTQLNYVPKLQCELSVTQEAHLDAVKICRTNIKVIKRFPDNKLPIN